MTETQLYIKNLEQERDRLRAELEQAKAENARLRETIGDFLRECDLLSVYDQSLDGSREWVSVGTWLHKGDAIADISEAQLARLRSVMEGK